MRAFVGIVVLGVVAIVAALWLFNTRVAKAPSPTPTATTTTTTTGNEEKGILPYNSGVQGTVTLGPTCPVMREPPDPQCADKPYATAIMVYRKNSTTPFIIGNSDVTGAFKFSLPPGTYTLRAGGDKMLPRCSPIEAIVSATGYTLAPIPCDTGIR